VKRNNTVFTMLLCIGTLWHTTLAVAQSARAEGRTIAPGQTSALAIKTLPNASCKLHIEGQTNPSMDLFADDEGMLHVYAQPTAESENIASFVADCTAAGNAATFPLQLRANSTPTPDMPAPGVEVRQAAPGAHVRPALTEAEASQLSQDDLTKKGYPIRPDPVEAPDAFANWMKAVSQTATFVPSHAITHTGVTHKRQKDVSATLSYAINYSCVLMGHCWESSPNWSGYELRGDTLSYDTVMGEWNVPSLSGEYYGQTYSSFWIGIDGDYSNGINDGPVQTGTAQDIKYFYYPGWGGLYLTNFYAWNEIVPNQPYEQVMSNFSVAPGDTIFSQVWLSYSPGGSPYTFGGWANYFIEDVSKNEYTTTSVWMNGLPISGTEAEWIMERPSRNGSYYADLANYGTAYMWDAYASNGSSWVSYDGAFYEILSMYGCSTSGSPINCPTNTNDLLSAPFQVNNTEMGFTWYGWH
jgi:Peptidase A4 family